MEFYEQVQNEINILNKAACTYDKIQKCLHRLNVEKGGI